MSGSRDLLVITGTCAVDARAAGLQRRGLFYFLRGYHLLPGQSVRRRASPRVVLLFGSASSYQNQHSCRFRAVSVRPTFFEWSTRRRWQRRLNACPSMKSRSATLASITLSSLTMIGWFATRAQQEGTAAASPVPFATTNPSIPSRLGFALVGLFIAGNTSKRR